MNKLLIPSGIFLFVLAIALAIMPVTLVPCLLGGILYFIAHRRNKDEILTDNKKIRSVKLWAMMLIISPIPIIAAVFIFLGDSLFMAG